MLRAELVGAFASRLREARAFLAGGLRLAWSHRAVRVAVPSLALSLLAPAAVLLHQVYLARTRPPDLEPFISLKPPVDWI
jgi:hypothetical protein